MLQLPRQRRTRRGERGRSVAQIRPIFKHGRADHGGYAVDVIGRLDCAQRVRNPRIRHCESKPYVGQSQRFGTGFQNHKIIIVLNLAEQTLIPKIHIRLVEDNKRFGIPHKRAHLGTGHAQGGGVARV